MKEIYIRRMKPDEARFKLEREMNEAFMAGEKEVEVVHGIGEGVLRRITIEYVNESGFLELAGNDFFQNNPGVTKVYILGPDKYSLKKVKQ